ncbi:YibE/F family protein [Bacillus sp. A301a_S52]|nr:YibE/F family protein [Bacillus sp. A301a_S52]
MNALVLLGIILYVLMRWIGGEKGSRSFFALFLNFIVLFFTIIFMINPYFNPIILTVVACVIISCINLFYINEINIKTVTAFVSSIITISILLVVIVLVTDRAMIQGFSEEEINEIAVFSIYLGVDFVKIGASVIIMSTIGAITDIAISISSPMHEMIKHHPAIKKRELFLSGITIGRDLLGTSANTLFFAFFGGYLALLIWFKDLDYSIGQIANSKVFSAEMITIFSAGIGVALVIPLTAWITATVFIKQREKNESVN